MSIPIYARSCFRNPAVDLAWMEAWTRRIEGHSKRSYLRTVLQTSLGATQVFILDTGSGAGEPLVIFPGARTSVLFWDLDRNLDNLPGVRIFLVETNGLPNLSEGSTPDIKGPGYGIWAREVLDKLQLDRAFIAGASFGGLVCMKLACQAPDRVKGAFLLNPGCLQSFSLSFRNLYCNLLPIVAPSERSVRFFLKNAVFCKPDHQPSPEAEQLIVEYELFALTRYKDKTQKPYFMKHELRNAVVNTYLLVGDHDLLFPFEKSVQNAKALLPQLKHVEVFKNVGHGIETLPDALRFISQRIDGSTV